MEDRASSPINSGLAQGFWLATRKPVNDDHDQVYWINKSIHRIGRFRRRALLLLAALGPCIITMIADNDAGGISTYAQTGARSGLSLLWAFIILVPMAYYVQEMTVRLGAVTKRGHAHPRERSRWLANSQQRISESSFRFRRRLRSGGSTDPDHGEHRHHDYPVADLLSTIGSRRQGYGC